MELLPINLKNVWEITNLKVQESQKDFVASNGISIIEAYATLQSGYVALPFAIYEDGTAIGFVMIGYGTIGGEDEPAISIDNYCIWRFMIDEKYLIEVGGANKSFHQLAGMPNAILVKEGIIRGGKGIIPMWLLSLLKTKKY